MDYLLDANASSDLMRDHPELSRRLLSLPPGDRAITCPIVKGEVLHGIARLPDGKRKQRLQSSADALFSALPCVSIPEAASNCYAKVKLIRERQGLSMAENDLWIAATALVYEAVLVSRDSDMQMIDGLRVEDWSQALLPSS